MEGEMQSSSPTTAQNQNMMGALCYLLGFVTGIVFILVEKQNKFVRFHAWQSTITFGGLFVIQLIPVIGWMLSFILVPVNIILWLFLMWKAYSGEEFMLPVVGEMARKQVEKTA